MEQRIMMTFRATPDRRKRLLMLAQGEGTTITDVLNRLIDDARVEPVERVTRGLALVEKNNSRSAQNFTAQGATAVGA
jgi:hypothetical protein